MAGGLPASSAVPPHRVLPRGAGRPSALAGVCVRVRFPRSPALRELASDLNGWRSPSFVGCTAASSTASGSRSPFGSGRSLRTRTVSSESGSPRACLRSEWLEVSQLRRLYRRIEYCLGEPVALRLWPEFAYAYGFLGVRLSESLPPI